MKNQMNKFRLPCFLLAFGAMIMASILPGNISRLARAEEMGVTTRQANKDALAAEQPTFSGTTVRPAKRKSGS